MRPTRKDSLPGLQLAPLKSGTLDPWEAWMELASTPAEEGHSPGEFFDNSRGNRLLAAAMGGVLLTCPFIRWPQLTCGCACRVLLCGTVPYSQPYAINVYYYCYSGTLTARPSTPPPARRVRACSRCCRCRRKCRKVFPVSRPATRHRHCAVHFLSSRQRAAVVRCVL